MANAIIKPRRLKPSRDKFSASRSTRLNGRSHRYSILIIVNSSIHTNCSSDYELFHNSVKWCLLYILYSSKVISVVQMCFFSASIPAMYLEAACPRHPQVAIKASWQPMRLPYVHATERAGKVKVVTPHSQRTLLEVWRYPSLYAH